MIQKIVRMNPKVNVWYVVSHELKKHTRKCTKYVLKTL